MIHKMAAKVLTSTVQAELCQLKLKQGADKEALRKRSATKSNKNYQNANQKLRRHGRVPQDHACLKIVKHH